MTGHPNLARDLLDELFRRTGNGSDNNVSNSQIASILGRYERSGLLDETLNGDADMQLNLNVPEDVTPDPFESELRVNKAWLNAKRTRHCRVCHDLEPRAHYQSRVVRSPLTRQLVSFVKTEHIQQLWDFHHRGGINRTCGYCDLITRAVFDLILSRVWAQSLQQLQFGSLILVEGQPALLTLDLLFGNAWKTFGIEIFKTAQEDDIPGLPALGGASRIAAHAGDEQCMGFVWTCLDACIKHHERCKFPMAPLPKRVLWFDKEDAGSKGAADIRFSVKLHISGRSETDRYAALSHCWGSGSPLKATKENLTALQDAVDWDRLPKTFQDGVIVAHRLGLQYLWVDSLCIIQNDNDDWDVESLKMGDIYRNAYVTIAGSSSPSGSHRFLDDRPLLYEPVPLKFFGPRKASLAKRFLAQVGLRKPTVIHAKLTSRNVPEERVVAGWSKMDPWDQQIPGPLSKRGWTLQERLLSTRIIHFTLEGVIYECLEEARREDSRCSLPSLTRRWEDFAPVTSLSGEEAIKMRNNLQTWWHELLTEYTLRNLTYRKDILRAISSVAIRMQSLIGSPYLAGLWQDRFVEGLCWRPSLSSFLDKVPPLPIEEKHLTPGMPTWSCFSISHPIGFAVSNHAGVFEPHCKLVSSDFVFGKQQQSQDNFVSLSGRGVVLEGNVISMELTYPPQWENAMATSGTLSLKGGDWSRRLVITDAPLVEDTALMATGEPGPTVRRAREGDKKVNIRSSHTVLALDVARWMPVQSSLALEGADQHYVLILAPSKSVPGAYERLGMTDSSRGCGYRGSARRAMFKHGVVRRIEIV